MISRLLSICLIFSVLACAQGKSDKKKSSSGDDDPEAEGSDTDTKSATGTDADTETESNTGTGTETGDGKSTPVLAFFGGYTSCGTGDTGDPFEQELNTFYEAAAATVKKKGGVEPKFLVTCYTLAYESVLYRISGQDGIQDKLIAGMEDDFEDLLGTLDDPEILMVGHSYGGWTAMDVALKLPPGAKLKGLVTLDPISHEDCVTNDVIASQFQPVPGCTRAPEDFGEEKIKKLAEATPEWLNYYQTQVSFLHSGEIKGAKNFKRQYTGSGFGPHNAFLTDEDIGKEISTLADHSF